MDLIAVDLTDTKTAYDKRIRIGGSAGSLTMNALANSGITLDTVTSLRRVSGPGSCTGH
jgi:hypothetical protein